MNVVEGLQTLRRRLDERGADPATLKHVDQIMQRAALPAAAGANAPSLLQLVRMLMRHPTAASDNRVYNDLAGLEEQIENAAAIYREQQAREDARPVPKTKKYYKELKEREQKTGR
jgi:hypothetical protein